MAGSVGAGARLRHRQRLSAGHARPSAAWPVARPGAGEEGAALDKATGPLFTGWRQPVRSAIFAQYCTPRHSTSGQAVASGFGMPLTYARHSVIDVEWLTARKVCVYAIDHAHLQCRFVLMKKGNTCLLDHMQNLFDGWKKGYL
nr:NTF2 fold immunity protein [Massilia sp. CCM 8734]